MDINLNLLNPSSEVFSILFFGISIFVMQKFISDFWLKPNLKFKKSLARVDTLLDKAKGIYVFTYGKNNMKSGSGLSVDEEINKLRKEIYLAAYILTNTYSGLFILEKFFYS